MIFEIGYCLQIIVVFSVSSVDENTVFRQLAGTSAMKRRDAYKKYMTRAKAMKGEAGGRAKAPVKSPEDSETEIESDIESQAKTDSESKSRSGETKTFESKSSSGWTPIYSGSDTEVDTDTETQAKTGTECHSSPGRTPIYSGSEIEDLSESKPGTSSQAKLPLSQQEPVDPTDWWKKYKDWSDVGTQVTKKWPKKMGLEPTEYRFAAKQGITLGKKLASGSQGTVWRAKVKDDSTGEVSDRAVKVLNLFNFSNMRKRNLNDAMDFMMREADNVSDLEHPNLVTPKAIVNIHDKDTQFPYCRVLLVMELCDGDLQSMIDRKDRFSERLTRKVMTHLCQGLKYLHENRVAHMDIKPPNILYVGSGDGRQYKLTDFGLSYRFGPGEKIKKRLGTYGYIAPEMDGKHRADPEKADIYSLGMTMLNLLVGDQNYLKLGKQLSAKSTKREMDVITKQYSISLEACLLAQAMTKDNYQERADLDTVMADKWFSLDGSSSSSSPSSSSGWSGSPSSSSSSSSPRSSGSSSRAGSLSSSSSPRSSSWSGSLSSSDSSSG